MPKVLPHLLINEGAYKMVPLNQGRIQTQTAVKGAVHLLNRCWTVEACQYPWQKSQLFLQRMLFKPLCTIVICFIMNIL